MIEGVSIESALWTSDEATFQRQGQERNDCMHGCVLRAESEQTIWLDQYSRSAKCDKNTVVTVDKVGKEDIASSHHPRAIKQKHKHTSASIRKAKRERACAHAYEKSKRIKVQEGEGEEERARDFLNFKKLQQTTRQIYR